MILRIVDLKDGEIRGLLLKNGDPINLSRARFLKKRYNLPSKKRGVISSQIAKGWLNFFSNMESKRNGFVRIKVVNSVPLSLDDDGPWRLSA